MLLLLFCFVCLFVVLVTTAMSQKTLLINLMVYFCFSRGMVNIQELFSQLTFALILLIYFGDYLCFVLSCYLFVYLLNCLDLSLYVFVKSDFEPQYLNSNAKQSTGERKK